jgi:hypothetical protein
MGGRNLFMTIWYGLFFQVVLPLLIVAYTVWLFVFHPVSHVLGVLGLIYVVYLGIAAILYALFLLLVSERPRQDLRLLAVVPLFPLFSFAARSGARCHLNGLARRTRDFDGSVVGAAQDAAIVSARAAVVLGVVPPQARRPAAAPAGRGQALGTSGITVRQAAAELERSAISWRAAPRPA